MLSAEQCKESISDRYIQDFKKELGFFEKIFLTPVFSKMKSILKSDKKIEANNIKDLEDLWFWRNILGIKIWEKQLFENLVNKTFNFLKEKQEKIIQAQTEWKLDELLDVVVNWKLGNLDQSVNEIWATKQEETWDVTPQQNEWWATKQEETWDVTPQQNEWWDTEQEKWLDPKNHPVETWVATWVTSAIAYKKSLKVAENKLGLAPKEFPTEFNAAETQKTLRWLADQMETKANWGVKMSRLQKYTYNKSIKNFREAADSLDKKTAMAFKDRQKLWKKMPPNFLKHLNVDSKVLDLIDALPENELAKIIGKSEKEVVEILGNKWIKISEDFAKSLKLAWNVQEIKQITNIARNGRKLSSFIKWVKWMWVITFLLMWLDVRYYFDGSKEADLVKKINEVRGQAKQDEATAQLLIWLGWVALEALALRGVCAAGGSVWWPIWTVVGLCVWAIIAAASFITSSHYEKKEFYAQNRYDFINKKRTEVKQSIVQLFESDRLNMHEWMKKSIKDDRGPKSEINTMEDAWEALIYQEEIMEWRFQSLQLYYSSWESEWDYKKGLNDEEKKQYEEEKKEMENIIKLRMEYIKQYVKEDKKSKQYEEMKNALKNNKWLEYVEQLLADSKVYSYLKSDHEDAYVKNYKELNVDTYKKAYEQQLSQEYKEEFAMFEKLRKENSSLLWEICRWTSNFKWIIWESLENESWEACYSEQEKTKIKRNMDFIVKYEEYLNIGRPVEKQATEWNYFNAIDYRYIEQVLIDINSIDKRPTWDKEPTLNYLTLDEFNNMTENIDSQVSNSVFQNVIYSIAREVHGYTWKNDKLELVSFYTCDWDSTWIYMDGKRKIKDVSWFFGTKDRTVDDPDKFTKEQALNMIVKEVDLDSVVEAADDNLTQEFRERVKKIIDREYGYREKKKDYEKQIIDFIKSNNNWQDGYVELPENLVINAKKAWIWDVHRFLFRVEEWQIIALCRWDTVNTVLHFDDNNIKYEALNPLRSELTQQEKKLISYVDDMEKKLNKLRGKQWSIAWIIPQHADDLDIPEYLERIMSQKSIEWGNLKKSVLYMEPKVAHDYLIEKSEECFNFFNWMYLWILNRVTNMKRAGWLLNSNDMDSSADFLQATQFIWFNVAVVKNWKLEINKSINEAIRKHLPDLFDSYKDWTTWKTVKNLLLDEDETNQRKWQELAKKICELCLEQAVLKFNSAWNVDNITTKDFSDNDLEKVKEKMKKWLDGTWFQKAYDESVNVLPKFDYTTSIRKVELAEVDTHKEIDNITENIINTMKHVDWANERKEPKFEADTKQNKEWKVTWKFSSRWYSEKITINMDNSKKLKSITIDWLDMTFSDIDEWFRTVNLINFIHHNAEKHPRWESAEDRVMWSYWLYHRSNGWDLERDVTNNMNDVDILENDYLEKKYPKIHEDKDFLNYINDFL